MGFKRKGGRTTYSRKLNSGYIYKNCSRCGRYNGTSLKMCLACRKKAR